MRAVYQACVYVLATGLVPVAGVAATPNAPGAQVEMDTEAATSLRLSPSQYRQTIADIFDDSVKVDGRFEPELRTQGLLAIGGRVGNITDSGLRSYYDMAQSVSAQVVDPQHRATLIGCAPRADREADDTCAKSFFARVAPLVQRRPVSEEEVQRRVAVARMAAEKLHDFYGGIQQSLTEMLISPEFLFRFRRMEADPARPGHVRMNAYDMASELSYFLWNTTPDEELMQAAQSGQLHTRTGLEKQANRLIVASRVADSIRAIFSDMLGFSEFEAVSKDPNFFPRYTANIKLQTQEQTLRTIVDHVVNQHGDYRDLFTTAKTFLTKDLAALYDVPFVDTTDNGQPQRWLPYVYPPDDPRAGILAQASFTTLWSPSGRTSPTVRGKALREIIFCQRVPPPPGNVSFKFVEDTSNPQYRTTRARITAHRSDAMCAGCHKLTDPLGLALENFDSAGGFRQTENGAAIDASGEINGKAFDGPMGLAKAVHDDPAATSCVAQRTFAFETGYMPRKDDTRWQEIQAKFAASKYDVLELMRQIAISDLSYDPPGGSVISASNR